MYKLSDNYEYLGPKKARPGEGESFISAEAGFPALRALQEHKARTLC